MPLNNSHISSYEYYSVTPSSYIIFYNIIIITLSLNQVCYLTEYFLRAPRVKNQQLPHHIIYIIHIHIINHCAQAALILQVFGGNYYLSCIFLTLSSLCYYYCIIIQSSLYSSITTHKNQFADRLVSAWQSRRSCFRTFKLPDREYYIPRRILYSNILKHFQFCKQDSIVLYACIVCMRLYNAYIIGRYI